jgi:broad specificity phosphatase PhoE
MRQNWPERLWLVRHGQSQGNVARDAADQAGAHEIDVELRDVDVPLSTLGEEHAEAAINSRRRPPTAAVSANSTIGRQAARAGPT